MEEHGKIIALVNERAGVSQRTGETWKSVDVVIETDGRYPRRICATLFGTSEIERADLKIGEYATIKFEIDAREYAGKWYNDVRIWDVVKYGNSMLRQHVQTPQEAQAQLVTEETQAPY